MGEQKKPKNLNQPKNQTETESKNRLIEPNDLVFFFFYTNLGFDLGFSLQNTKTIISINQPKIYIYI